SPPNWQNGPTHHSTIVEPSNTPSLPTLRSSPAVRGSSRRQSFHQPSCTCFQNMNLYIPTRFLLLVALMAGFSAVDIMMCPDCQVDVDPHPIPGLRYCSARIMCQFDSPNHSHGTCGAELVMGTRVYACSACRKLVGERGGSCGVSHDAICDGSDPPRRPTLSSGSTAISN
ncbi:hypothetical protein PTTG_26287, partial [Puccinia triticina 1-1 BBBD Race 1]